MRGSASQAPRSRLAGVVDTCMRAFPRPGPERLQRLWPIQHALPGRRPAGELRRPQRGGRARLGRGGRRARPHQARARHLHPRGADARLPHLRARAHRQAQRAHLRTGGGRLPPHTHRSKRLCFLLRELPIILLPPLPPLDVYVSPRYTAFRRNTFEQLVDGLKAAIPEGVKHEVGAPTPAARTRRLPCRMLAPPCLHAPLMPLQS